MGLYIRLPGGTVAAGGLAVRVGVGAAEAERDDVVEDIGGESASRPLDFAAVTGLFEDAGLAVPVCCRAAALLVDTGPLLLGTAGVAIPLAWQRNAVALR